MYVPTLYVQLRHTKLPSLWDSHVDALAEVWKMLVAVIVSMILLMLPATRTRRGATKTILQTASDFSTNLHELKT